MEKEDKELLLKDLCARLPYGVVINTGDKDLKLNKHHQCIGILYQEDCSDEFNKRNNNASFYITISGCYYGEDIKPYLRPMSSMTEEERDFANNEFFKNSDNFQIDDVGEMYTESQPFESIYTLSLKIQSKYLDWLNSHHFDYRGLIEKGLAIEAPEGMYKFNE